MKAFLVDDEAHVLKIVQSVLESDIEIEVVGKSQTIDNAVELINKLKPDILFLDVELKEGLSFEILDQLSYSDYRLVFITAHSHYALKAIKFSAFDYLLKPVNPNELLSVVNKLKTEKNIGLEERISALEKNIFQKNEPKKIVLKTAEKYIITTPDEIVSLEADNIYTTCRLLDGRKIVLSTPIKHFDEILHDNAFFRCHRSYMINTNQIKEYVKSDGGYLIMKTGDHIPVATSRVKDLIKIL